MTTNSVPDVVYATELLRTLGSDVLIRRYRDDAISVVAYGREVACEVDFEGAGDVLFEQFRRVHAKGTVEALIESIREDRPEMTSDQAEAISESLVLSPGPGEVVSVAVRLTEQLLDVGMPCEYLMSSGSLNVVTATAVERWRLAPAATGRERIVCYETTGIKELAGPLRQVVVFE